MYSISQKILRSLPAACPLCGMGARGGDLCVGCAHDLELPFNVRARCHVCFEAVPATAVSHASFEGHEQAKILEASGTPEWLAAGEITGFAPAVRCARCLRQPPAYARLVAAIEYTYPGDMLIQRFKEGARLTYAGLFARLLWSRLHIRSRGCQAKAPLGALVPIPSSQSALKRRGFNPASELARELARLSGYPLLQEWLIRTREACTQKTLDARARRESVEGLYACPNAVPDVWVGLVDDVVTTGSTMHIAARALISAGAAGVVGLAAAHTPRAWQNDTYD
jgi:ComF family protein